MASFHRVLASLVVYRKSKSLVALAHNPKQTDSDKNANEERYKTLSQLVTEKLLLRYVEISNPIEALERASNKFTTLENC